MFGQGSRVPVLELERGDRVLVVAPPGSGATLAARRAWEALPPFEPGSREQAEASDLWVMAGMAGSSRGAARWSPLQHDDEPELPLVRRPLRAPHHTVSVAGLVGSGQAVYGEAPRSVGRRGRGRAADRPVAGYRFHPGEVSLAHGGVLLLDEVVDFHGQALEALAYALRSGVSTIVRGAATDSPSRVDLPAVPYAVVMTVDPGVLERHGSRLDRYGISPLVTRVIRL